MCRGRGLERRKGKERCNYNLKNKNWKIGEREEVREGVGRMTQCVVRQQLLEAGLDTLLPKVSLEQHTGLHHLLPGGAWIHPPGLMFLRLWPSVTVTSPQRCPADFSVSQFLGGIFTFSVELLRCISIRRQMPPFGWKNYKNSELF